MKNDIKKIIGHIGVDAGLCWLGDPCYVLPKDATDKIGRDWGKFCDEFSKKKKQGCAEFNSGVCVQTGWGDGYYPVYATFSNDGRVSSVTVDFMGEDEDDDEDELS